MAIFKCKMCGGTIEFEPGASVGVCDHCGTTQTLPRLDDDRRANLYDRADHFRRSNDFDKAAGIYESLLNEDDSDAEVYWLLVLCRYGVEYVEDPVTHKRVPTVNRAQYTSIFDDADYRSALSHADLHQRAIYEAEAAAINEIQKGILAISQKEEPFDVFICYKETDETGHRTPDSVLANDLYYQLTNEGFKVFFARITLEGKLGTAYEPYIFAALNSAKVMVVLGTRPEYFNAVWVKNEWSRFLTLVKAGDGKKVLIPAYRDMDPYDLPEEFSHLQAQDMSKLGFMQDLIHGIKKLTAKETPKPAVVKETVVRQTENGNLSAILERGFLALEDCEWAAADAFFEQALNFDAQNALAYLGKLMAELRVPKQEFLKDCPMPFDGSRNFQKVMRFGNEKLVAALKGDISHIIQRNETARQAMIYNNACGAMYAANDEASFKNAAEMFRSIPGFQDADALAAQCLENAEISRKDYIYNSAVYQMNAAAKNGAAAGYEEANRLLQTIPGWRDADQLAAQCVSDAQVCRKNSAYNYAMQQMGAGTVPAYEAAIRALSGIHGWRDADAQISRCKNLINEIAAREEAVRMAAYRAALEHENSAKTAAECNAAKKEFMALNHYRDADNHIMGLTRKAEMLKQQAKEKRRKRFRNFLIIMLVLLVAAILVVTVVIPELEKHKAGAAVISEDVAQAVSLYSMPPNDPV